MDSIGGYILLSIRTTEANSIVEPIHENAMRVMLIAANDIEQWLEENVAEALAPQRPAANDAIVMAPLAEAA
jgi:putative SOS response-associated peptidase YedK